VGTTGLFMDKPNVMDVVLALHTLCAHKWWLECSLLEEQPATGYDTNEMRVGDELRW
jgi:hypothetical protein